MRRALDGVLLLDKAAGMTSNAALQGAKRLFQAKKAGHAGTLDPLATGLLPILFGEATKFANFLLEADKEYLAEVRLGVRTSTGDAEGEVLERRVVAVSDSRIEAALAALRGPILQTPPMYSALKLQGRPLYELARQGRSVERAARAVTISRLQVVQRRSEDLLDLDVRCSKGTYVRTLAEDLGTILGTGAHLAGLRRTAAGGFGIAQAFTLDGLQSMSESGREACLLPVDGLLRGLRRVDLEPGLAERFMKGGMLPMAGMAPGLCAVYRGGVLLGVGEAGVDGVLRPARLRVQVPANAQAADNH